jgi:hypothetical protein
MRTRRMNKLYSRVRTGWQKRMPQNQSSGAGRCLLNAEEEILHSISTRVPLPVVLNGICSALDRQIRSVVSLISLPWDYASQIVAVPLNVAAFGLRTYCCAALVGENDEPLGSLEMYCCVPRRPSPCEFQLIARAAYLAAIAITLGRGMGEAGDCGARAIRPGRGRVLEWPVSRN